MCWQAADVRCDAVPSGTFMLGKAHAIQWMAMLHMRYHEEHASQAKALSRSSSADAFAAW